MIKDIINEKRIESVLKKTQGPSRKIISDIFEKAKAKKGLSLQEAGFLVNSNSQLFLKKLFGVAGQVKNEIYGERLVFFAPLYISDFCVNDCQYCNFHASNKESKRKRLTFKEIEEQTRCLIDMGHKRLLLECGEDPVNNDIDYVTKAIGKIYSVKTKKGNIRRINVNIAATGVENYRKLKKANIGTYQLFQETYHKPTYESLHSGPKRDYARQLTAHLRAFEAGLDDLGLGVLFGLYDWRFEMLALISHAQYLDKTTGVGPHTISVPRFCPAPTVDYKPPYPVSDEDFFKIIAILRLAVPYTGMIISTREKSQIRKIAFSIGISQASAASVTSVGGYGKANLCHPEGAPFASLKGRLRATEGSKEEILRRFALQNDTSNLQFSISDERSLQEVIRGVLEDNLLPSFCTACYRTGRTGEKFMELSKPGEIHNFCRPNGILTFAEYLEGFGRNGIYKKGYEVINFYLGKIDDESLRHKTIERLEKIKQGERDLYF